MTTKRPRRLGDIVKRVVPELFRLAGFMSVTGLFFYLWIVTAFWIFFAIAVVLYIGLVLYGGYTLASFLGMLRFRNKWVRQAAWWLLLLAAVVVYANLTKIIIDFALKDLFKP